MISGIREIFGHKTGLEKKIDELKEAGACKKGGDEKAKSAAEALIKNNFNVIADYLKSPEAESGKSITQLSFNDKGEIEVKEGNGVGDKKECKQFLVFAKFAKKFFKNKEGVTGEEAKAIQENLRVIEKSICYSPKNFINIIEKTSERINLNQNDISVANAGADKKEEIQTALKNLQNKVKKAEKKEKRYELAQKILMPITAISTLSGLGLAIGSMFFPPLGIPALVVILSSFISWISLVIVFKGYLRSSGASSNASYELKNFINGVATIDKINTKLKDGKLNTILDKYTGGIKKFNEQTALLRGGNEETSENLPASFDYQIPKEPRESSNYKKIEAMENLDRYSRLCEIEEELLASPKEEVKTELETERNRIVWDLRLQLKPSQEEAK